MKKILAIALCTLFFGNGPSHAQSRDKDTKAIYKAAYLFSFTKLVDWPSTYKKGAFTIGLLTEGGKTNLYQELKKKYEGKRIGDQTIHIKNYESEDRVDKNCNVLFVGKGETSSLATLKNKDRSTLLVAERPGALQRGAVINFVVKNNKLEYVLSRSNAERYGLTVGNQLRELAYKVR